MYPPWRDTDLRVTRAQRRMMRELAGNAPVHVMEYNELAAWIRCRVERQDGSVDVYAVAPDAHDCYLVMTSYPVEDAA